jgi:hypothetical protein
MDAVKVREFKDTINEYRALLTSGRTVTSAEEKFEILERFEDTWYEPLCFAYNLMAPFDYPKYIKSQWQQAKEVPEGQVFIYITLGYGQWIFRENLMAAMANVQDG